MIPWEQLLGSASMLAAVAALIHAVSRALSDRSTAVRLDAETRARIGQDLSLGAADIRARLDRCELEHRERDDRDRARANTHAAEIGALRGHLAALRDEFEIYRTSALSGHS